MRRRRSKPGLRRRDPSKHLEYLCVDDFMKSLVDARALKSAFELDLIDHLREHQPRTLDELENTLAGDRAGLRLLLDLLVANRVVEERSGAFRLSSRFLIALRYRDVLETKLDFANFVAPDFIDLFTSLINDPGRFMRDARVFDLFGYHRCFDRSPENYELTKRWMRITTALTKYEARACMHYHDFGRYTRMLDIGGNSGEFALQVCKEHPRMHATVVDLPLVCDIGQEHVLAEPEGDRITFIKGNALEDPLPTGFDLITFKSMLHDWPEHDAKGFIARASHSLNPGGTMLIFERGPIQVGDTTVPYSMIPLLLFFRAFRSPLLYKAQLEAVGLRDVHIQEIELEMPFSLVTARKE